MNDINELVSHGINIKTAQRMIDNYKEKIGTINGDFEIIDINYDFGSSSKDITLKCCKCGKIIHRTMINRKNKWSELIKTCYDCKNERKILEIKKTEEEKRNLLILRLVKYMAIILYLNQ